MGEQVLEKGFDESELEDIMSEIESLEKDFVSTVDISDVAEEDKVMASEASEKVEEPIAESTPNETKVEENVDTVATVAEDVTPVISEDISEEAKTPSADLEQVVEMPEEPQATVEDIEQRLESEFNAQDSTSDAENLKIDPKEVGKTAIQAEVENEVESMLDSTSTADVLPMQPSQEDAHSSPVIDKGPEDGATTKMDFSVSGQMNLKLHFWVNGQGVDLWVSESEGFVIEMEGGARFSIPLTNKKAA